jgi:hypothetical protein
MRQGDGSDLLGAHDARSASIGIIYVAPTDDRPSVLEAILMQDKLGRKQVAVVLPENSRAFQRPVDFDGLKNMRRGLKTEIIFVAPGVPGPAEFARQRRFTVYTSLESYAAALRAEVPDNGNAKKGLPLFGRKPKLVPNLNEPAPLVDLDDLRPPEPLPAPISPVAAASEPVSETPFLSDPPDDDHDTDHDRDRDDDGEKRWDIDPLIALGGAGVVGADLAADDWMSSASTQEGDPGSGSYVAPPMEDENAQPVSSRPRRDPGIIPLPFTLPAAQPRPISGKLPAANAPGSSASASLPVSSRAAYTTPGPPPVPIAVPPPGGGQPPFTGNTGGSGGGGRGGPQRRRTRQLLAIALIILTLLLLAGIAFASPVGQGLIGHFTGSTTTAIVTITPDHQPVSVSLVIVAVTGKPTPTVQQVQATILSYTTPTPQSASANATGSIRGANATGTLTFINTGFSGVTINGGVLTGKSGVPVSFNGPLFIPVGSVSVVGTAVNAGVGGDIPQFDIAGTCCGSSNILVRNTTAFAGGRDPVPNSVITQNDINSATNKLISNITPSAQAALQQKVQPGQQVVSNSLKCTPNVTSNQRVGAQVKSVTVTGTVTCTEEVYDQVATLKILTDALKAKALKNLGAGFDLVGNVITNVTSTTVDANNTVTLDITAQGEWVYHFTDTTLNALKAKIAKESKSLALADVLKVTGVSKADISISDGGDMMPDVGNITIKIVPIPGLSGSPTPGSGSPTTTPGSPTSGTTPTSTPTITATPGLGGGPPATPTVLGGS